MVVTIGAKLLQVNKRMQESKNQSTLIKDLSLLKAPVDGTFFTMHP